MISSKLGFPTGPARMIGSTRVVFRNGQGGRVLVDETHKNNIVLNMRYPIISLIGAYNGVRMNYAINGGNWAQVPANGSISGVNGNIVIATDYTSLPVASRIAFGSDGTAPAETDTALYAALSNADKLLSAAPIFDPSGLKVTFSVAFAENELNNVTMREAVLKTSTNLVIARTAIGEYTKQPGMYFEFYWTIGYES